MFKRKKFMALCATTLAGISALGTLPQIVLADVTKAGDTVITYEGAPKPAEWGLSVPATINMDKKADNDRRAYGNGKVAIVNEDGTAFTDKTKARTFKVVGSGVNKDSNNQNVLVDANKGTATTAHLFARFEDQGGEQPTALISGVGDTAADSKDDVLTTVLESKIDNSIATHRWLQVNVFTERLQGQNVKTTLSWTATEETS
ncbi:hypothetical protein [Lactococcus taiwanensis]|uniref:hypothetical protein n=1 Tax=Lactococcus taiwanensis TaxID=1151742 RepID=UPI003511B720